jgi:glycogen(starch) synthase
VSRIALLPSTYLPTLGGVQELTRHLALTLAAGGDEVEIWWMQDDAVAAPSLDWLDGLRIRRFPFPLPKSRPTSLPGAGFGALKSIVAMRRAVREFRPDVLHVQCFGPNGAYATALSQLTRVPLIVTLQGETVMDDQDIFEHSTALRTALRFGLRRAAQVSACSAFTLRDAEQRFGLRPGRGSVIFNGVVLDAAGDGADDRAGAAGETGPAAGPLADLGRYVVALGRVVPKKGFDLLLRGFAQVAADHPDVTLAIGGDGSQLAELRLLATDLKLEDRVRFLGRLSREQVAATMAGAELFVMPSRLEPFGIVLLEAWRAGRPVIATSIGGPPEFVDEGRTGLLVDPFDTAALARALDRLLGDQALRAAMGAAARERVQDFGWPAIAERYRELYRRAV